MIFYALLISSKDLKNANRIIYEIINSRTQQKLSERNKNKCINKYNKWQIVW